MRNSPAGPIVRVSPTLCSISDPAAVKDVYGGKFPKSKKRYQGKVFEGKEHLLMFSDPSAVKERRGLMLPLFQRSNLEGFAEEMQNITSQLLVQMENEQQIDGSVDVFRWLRLAAFDIIG